MDEPEPMPAFSFDPDGPITITYPDGTVSVNAPQPDDTTASTMTSPDVSVTAAQHGDISSTRIPSESPDPLPAAMSTVPEPSGGIREPGPGTTGPEAAEPNDPTAVNEPLGWGAIPADATASNLLVNPDGSITTLLPDGSTQTAVRLPGGAMIVTSTTPPGANSQPAPADSARSRRRRGRSQ